MVEFTCHESMELFNMVIAKKEELDKDPEALQEEKDRIRSIEKKVSKIMWDATQKDLKRKAEIIKKEGIEGLLKLASKPEFWR